VNYIGLSEPLVSILENLTGRIRMMSAWCSFQQYFSYFWEVLVFSLSLWFFIVLTDIFYCSDCDIFYCSDWYFLLFWQCDIFYCSDSVIFFIVLTVIFFIVLTVIFFIVLTDIFYCSDWYFLLFWLIFFIVLTDIFCFSFNNLISFIDVWSKVFITGFVSGLTRQMQLVEQEVLTLPVYLILPPGFSVGLKLVDL
jgi:hypothetical protein